MHTCGDLSGPTLPPPEKQSGSHSLQHLSCRLVLGYPRGVAAFAIGRDGRAHRTVSGTACRCPFLGWHLGRVSTVSGTSSPGTSLWQCVCLWVVVCWVLPSFGNHVFGYVLVFLGEYNVHVAVGFPGLLPEPLVDTAVPDLVVCLWCCCSPVCWHGARWCWCPGPPEPVWVRFVCHASVPWYATPALP